MFVCVVLPLKAFICLKLCVICTTGRTLCWERYWCTCRNHPWLGCVHRHDWTNECGYCHVVASITRPCSSSHPLLLFCPSCVRSNVISINRMDLCSFALARPQIGSVIWISPNRIIPRLTRRLGASPLIAAVSRLSRPSPLSAHLQQTGAATFRRVSSPRGSSLHAYGADEALPRHGRTTLTQIWSHLSRKNLWPKVLIRILNWVFLNPKSCRWNEASVAYNQQLNRMPRCLDNNRPCQKNLKL